MARYLYVQSCTLFLYNFFTLSLYFVHVALFPYCTHFIFRYFQCTLSSRCTLFRLHFFYVELFLLHSFSVALSSCCTFSVSHSSLFAISFTFHVFFVAHFFHVILSSCCIFFRVALFSFSAIHMLHFFMLHFSCTLLKYCSFPVLHYFYTAVFSCCTIFILLFHVQHSFHAALSCVKFLQNMFSVAL